MVREGSPTDLSVGTSNPQTFSQNQMGEQLQRGTNHTPKGNQTKCVHQIPEPS
jgi:hypothetical protein